MDRRAFIASAGAFTASASFAQTQSPIRDKIVGVWQLSEASTIIGTDKLPWFGRTDPVTGLTIYHDTGWMSVQIAGARPMKNSREHYNLLSIDSKYDWLKEYYAYYGRFEVDEPSKTVIHTVSDSLVPERASVLRRQYELQGDMLTLVTEPRTEGGRTTFNRLIWKKAS